MEVAWTPVKLIQNASGTGIDKVTTWMLKDLVEQTRRCLEPFYRDDRHGKPSGSTTATSDDIFQSA